jgi:hypothetical protein
MPKTIDPIESNSRILTETVCTLKDVPALLPTRPCFATVWRWATRGVKRDGKTIKLETYKIGRQAVCSQESVHRFLEAIQ